MPKGSFIAQTLGPPPRRTAGRPRQGEPEAGPTQRPNGRSGLWPRAPLLGPRAAVSWIASLHTRGEGMSSPNLPLQPPLPSLPSPEPALQKAILHPLNNQARSPPRRFLSCGLFLLTKSRVCKTVTHGSGSPAQRPSYLPTPSHEGLPKLPLPPTDIGWPTEGQHASGVPEVTEKTVGCLPEAYQAESTPSMAGEVMMRGWAGSPAVGTGSPRPLDHPPPPQEGTVAGPCRKGP